MSSWIKPTYDEVVEEVTAIWKSYRSDADSAPLSDLWITARVVGRIISSVYSAIESARRDLFPLTSVGRFLDAWLYTFGQSNGGDSYGTIMPHVSSGTDALTVTCTAGTPSITDETLVDTAGNRYKINETYTFGGVGTYDADVISIDTGTACNLETGETLTFESPPAGIQATATLAEDLDGGLDAETEAEGQARLLRALQHPSLSGNTDHWVDAIEATRQGIYDAFVWSKRATAPWGYGTTDYMALQRGESGPDRFTTSTQDTLLEAQIEAEMPVRQMKQARHVSVTTLTIEQNKIIVIYELAPDASDDKYVDWDAHGYQKPVFSTTMGSKLIEVNTVYPSGTIESGDKVLIAGLEATVDLEPGNASAPVSGDYKKFTVTTWPWDPSLDISSDGPGGSGFYICAGGGLALDVHDAIVNYLDGLGPERGTYADGTSLDTWDDTIRIAWIKNAVIDAGDGDVMDVDTCTINGLTDDVGPAATSGVGVTIEMAHPNATYTGGEIQVFEKG